MKKVLIAGAALAALLAPFAAFALWVPGQPLVPATGCIGPAPYYQLFDLVTLANNLIDFAVYLAVLIATVMFTYAGILYVTAAGAGEANLEKAKKIFWTVFVGLVIVLASWLIVNIILSVITPGGLNFWTGKVTCVDYVTASGPGGSNITTVNSSTGQPKICSPATTGPCTITNLTPTFGSSDAAGNASKICNAESVGNPASMSTTDRTADGQPFSIGLFQINATIHPLTAASCLAAVGIDPGQTLNCPKAFNGTNFSATVADPAIYQQCTTALQNAQCNIDTAKQIYTKRGNSFKDWTTASPVGCNIP